MINPPPETGASAGPDPAGGTAERLRFVTASGSTYEVDRTHQLVRRLSGTAPPTPREGPDGHWRRYVHLTDPVIGSPVLILWASDGDGTGGGATLTNLVIRIQHRGPP